LASALFVTPLSSATLAQDDAGQTTDSATTTHIAPPSELTATDHPTDDGTAIDLKWQLSPDDTPETKPRLVHGYVIHRTTLEFRSKKPGQELVRRKMAQVPFGTGDYTDSNCERGIGYIYDVTAVGPDGTESTAVRLDKPTRGALQWFDKSRIWFAL